MSELRLQTLTLADVADRRRDNTPLLAPVAEQHLGRRVDEHYLARVISDHGRRKRRLQRRPRPPRPLARLLGRFPWLAHGRQVIDRSVRGALTSSRSSSPPGRIERSLQRRSRQGRRGSFPAPGDGRWHAAVRAGRASESRPARSANPVLSATATSGISGSRWQRRRTRSAVATAWGCALGGTGAPIELRHPTRVAVKTLAAR